MKIKYKGFILMEIIISTFIVSLIALGIIASYVNISNIYKKTNSIDTMTRIGNAAMEETLAGQTYNSENEKYQVDITENIYSNDLRRIEITVRNEELNEDITFISYRKKD